MRQPAKIKEWQSNERMAQWIEEAPDSAARKRRKAIWLTHVDRLHACRVAELLSVSTQAVWLWIGQYNKGGPDALERTGPGGRHRCFMTHDEEAGLLAPFIRRARDGKADKPTVIKSAVEKRLGQSVSMSYIYRLLRRHSWPEILAQSHAERYLGKEGIDFKTIASPWLRDE